jgi:hypothetical protein
MLDEFEKPTRRIQEEVIEPYAKRLGLQWPVKVNFAEVINDETVGEQEIMSPLVYSSGRQRIHYLVFPRSYLPSMQESTTETVELMVRARLGEEVDPLFYSGNFYEEYDSEIKDMLYYALKVDEVWTHDLYTALEPELFERNLGEEVNLLIATGKGSEQATVEAYQVPPLDIVMQSALNYADIKRHRMAKYLRPLSVASRDIRKLLGEGAVDLSHEVGVFYRDLPELPAQSEEALNLYEQKAGALAYMLGFPVYPVLDRKEGEWAWRAEMR